jgi:conjugal transfer/entry exclusion protein
VAAIKEGCSLFQQAKQSFVEIKANVDEAVGVGKELYSFWGKLSKMFGGSPKPATPKPVAKKKKEKFVAVDETQIKADIIKHLTDFFRLQEQLAAHIREEEEKSKNVYDPDANLMEAALKRVMALDQMAALEVEIREVMVYQTPGMGDLYSKVFKMRKTIAEEQEEARLKEEAKERFKRWQREEERRDFRAKSAYLVITFLFLLYLWGWFLFVGRLGKI